MSNIITNEIVDKRLESKNIKRLSNYKNSKAKMRWKCLKDGYEWDSPFTHIYQGRGCAKCAGVAKYTNATVDEVLRKKNIKRLENYKNSYTKMWFQCLIDNYKWKTRFTNISSNNTGCPMCGRNIKHSNKSVDKSLIGRNIKRVGKYKNSTTTMGWKCLNKNCNHKWTTSYGNIMSGSGCPECSAGKSERNVFNLIKKHIEYNYFEPHKPFYFNNRKYIPDFYLESKNKRIIIEYNGKQHYSPVKFYGITRNIAQQNFIKQKLRDKQLREYCRKNNIYLLEIPYWWNIEKITEKLIIISNKYNTLL